MTDLVAMFHKDMLPLPLPSATATTPPGPNATEVTGAGTEPCLLGFVRASTGETAADVRDWP
jgi:hypothetical protein